MIDLTAASFQQTIEQSTLPVLVDVWASWCVPCRTLAPQISRVADEFDGRVLVTKLDAEAHPSTVEQLGIKSLPTLLVFVSGKEVARKVGAAGGYAAIKQLLAPVLDSGAA